ncbi:helicase-related protein [Alicyclobacillus macrosporangiidus]|uniref:helicase-related protein n=1 Tax=Alicyclobacillus macrosporangiidus TaxID=392015 RepID=UPI000497368F|nr:helicase-related protein [Alicyclobacillus macrosporangiidus]
MKTLVYSDDKHYVEAAVHFIVTRRNFQRNGDDLVAAGLIDLDSATRAIVAHAIKGSRLRLKRNRLSFDSDNIFTDKHGYRFVTRPIGKLTHAIILHKSAVDEQLEPGQFRIIIVPDGGDIADLFTRRFASDFNLPYVAEWKDVIWLACNRRNFVQQLSVWTDPDVPDWKHVQAFEVSPNLTEEAAKNLLSDLLRSGSIQLPEGLTDAPALGEVLQRDEDGGYHVIDYLQTYAPHLATTIEEMATPAHDLDRPINPAIAQMARFPFPAQAHTVQAILNGLDQSKGVIASSDMGTGKSIISLAVANALAKRSKTGFAVLLLVPGITIPKWIRDEIGKTLPGTPVTVLESWKDVVRYRDKRIGNGKKPLEFVLLSRDTAKLGMPKVPALIYKERVVVAHRPETKDETNRKTVLVAHGGAVKYMPGTPDAAITVFALEDVWICPECHGIQKKTTQTAWKEAKKHDCVEDPLAELKLGFSDLATGVEEYTAVGIGGTERRRTRYVFKKSITEYHCTECGANLMRDAVPEREPVSGLKHRRLQPAWFIQRYLRGYFDLVIVDELHQYKSNSGQGEAMGAIVGASRRVLGLTGTLSDGKASSLYHLLWRICPTEMKADGLDHRALNKFVHLYGTLEQRGRYAADEVTEAGGTTSRKVILNPPKEIPGLSPKLFVNHLADKTVFLELGDMGLPLVELEERPIFVDMDDEHAVAYRSFHNALEGVMRQQYAIGNQHAFAKFIPSVVNAANQPHMPQEVWVGDESVSFFPPYGPDELTAKERRLLEDIQAELAQNRRCVVYVRYSGEVQQDRRIADVLKQHGIRAQVLQATVSPEDRVEWLEEAVKKGTQVVVCNAKLVEVGLDLLDFPTLMFYQFTDEIATMRQAARRAWRIGQHRTCKVFYYVYNGSYEMVQFKRMLQKRSHAMLLEGRLDKSEVAKFIEQDDKSASTYAIANCLGNVEDLAQKWKTLADKDIPSGVILLAEERFKREIQQAMRRLASETRRLAGVPEPEETIQPVPAAQTPRPVQPAPADAEVIALPLFAVAQGVQDVQGAHRKPVAKATVAQDATPLTYGEWRKHMGMVEKAKRVKKQSVADNQIMLFAL